MPGLKTRPPGASDLVSPAAYRLAWVAWQARDHPSDFKNGAALAKAVSVSYSLLRRWCKAANVDGRQFIHFARFFRVVWLAPRLGHRIADLVDIVNPSVLSRDLETAGIQERPISVKAYCVNQRFLQPKSPVVAQVLSLLNHDQRLR